MSEFSLLTRPQVATFTHNVLNDKLGDNYAMHTDVLINFTTAPFTQSFQQQLQAAFTKRPQLIPITKQKITVLITGTINTYQLSDRHIKMELLDNLRVLIATEFLMDAKPIFDAFIKLLKQLNAANDSADIFMSFFGAVNYTENQLTKLI